MKITLYCENAADTEWAKTVVARPESPTMEMVRHDSSCIAASLYDAVVVERDAWHVRAEVAQRARDLVYAELCKQLGIHLDPDRPFLKIQDAIGKLWSERDDLTDQLNTDATRRKLWAEKAVEARVAATESNRAYIYSSLSKQLGISLDPDVPLVRIQDAIGKLITDTVMVDDSTRLSLRWKHRAEVAEDTLYSIHIRTQPRGTT